MDYISALIQESTQNGLQAQSVITEDIKLLEENIREKLHDTSLGSDFLAMALKVEAMKTKIDKWDCI